MKRNSRRQREAAQKRVAVLFCSIVAVVMICSVMFGAIRTQAAPAETTVKYYTSIQVESGDTLWDLARDFGPDDQDVRRVIKHICKINNVSPETLQPGQVLLIPVEL